MEFKNTIQSLQKFGTNVVKEGRGILKRKKKTTSGNTLYNDFDYLVTTSKDSITLEFEFGGAEDYWQFVDEGVKGAGGFKGLGRDERGRFVSRKSLAFLIQRSIFQRGLERTQFFSKPFMQQLNKQTETITNAFADDLELALEQTLKN